MVRGDPVRGEKISEPGRPREGFSEDAAGKPREVQPAGWVPRAVPERPRAAAASDRLSRRYPMPDHDGRPPRARERADATAPARKRASRDVECVESHDETEASADEPSCSPTWSVVSLSELTSRASSPSDVSSSSVVAAAATVSCATSASASALAALEDEAGEDERRRFSNRPPSVHQASDTKPPRVDSRVSERGGSDETSGAFFFTEETFASPLRESPTPNANANAKPEEEEEAEEQPPCVGSAASAARGLVACLRAAAALRLRALARALEAEGDAATRDAAFFAECFASARAAFARVSLRAAAALENAARTVRGTTRAFVADARDTFRALAEAFGSEAFRRERRSEGVFGTVDDDGLDEEEKKIRRAPGSADDTPAAHRFMSRDFFVAAAVAFVPLAPAALWCAFSSACSKRT